MHGAKHSAETKNGLNRAFDKLEKGKTDSHSYLLTRSNKTLAGTLNKLSKFLPQEVSRWRWFRVCFSAWGGCKAYIKKETIF